MEDSAHKRPAELPVRLPALATPIGSVECPPPSLACSWYDVHAPLGYTYHFWDGPAVEALVGERYPQYAAAWKALPKDVERADFARCG